MQTLSYNQTYGGSRGLQYNVFNPQGRCVGYLINAEFYDISTWQRIGRIQDNVILYLGAESAGVVQGMQIILSSGDLWSLVLVPY